MIITQLGRHQQPVPTQDNESTLVTPYYQKFHRPESDNFNLITIGNNPELREQFINNTLPNVEAVTETSVFIKPVRRVINTIDDRFHIWLAVKPNGIEFSHNCTYPVVEITGDQWLLKLETTAVSLREKDFFPEVIWFEKVNQLRVRQSEIEPDKLTIIPYTSDPPCPVLERGEIDLLMEKILKTENFRYNRRMD